MKTQKLRLPVVFAFVTASVAGCHSSGSVSPTSPAPPPPASVQEGGIQMQEYRINHSDLPPDQRQRLISQLHATGGR